MATSAPTPAPRLLRLLVPTRLRALLAAGVVVAVLGVGARAQWTDGATAVATISTGSIDLRLGAAQVDDAPSETATLALADMVPGSSVSAALAIRNVGTVPFTYSMTASTTGTLASGLRLSVYAGTACTGVPTVIPDAALTGATFSGRALTASGGATPAETLCFLVSLPAGAASSLQGATATATFTFAAVSA